MVLLAGEERGKGNSARKKKKIVLVCLCVATLLQFYEEFMRNIGAVCGPARKPYPE